MSYLAIGAAGFAFGIISVAVAFRMGSRWAQTTIENNIKSRGVTLVYGTLVEEEDEPKGGMLS